MSASDRQLGQLRAEIDEVDAQLAALFVARARLVRAAWQAKALGALPLVDEDRERQVAAHFAKLCAELEPEAVERFVSALLRVRAR